LREGEASKIGALAGALRSGKELERAPLPERLFVPLDAPHLDLRQWDGFETAATFGRLLLGEGEHWRLYRKLLEQASRCRTSRRPSRSGKEIRQVVPVVAGRVEVEQANLARRRTGR